MGHGGNGVGYHNSGRDWFDDDDARVIGLPGRSAAPITRETVGVVMGPGAGNGGGGYNPQGSAGGAGYSSYSSYTKKCGGHDGLTIVHAYGNKATLSGASRYDLMKHGIDLLIDCGVDVSNSSFVKSCPPGFEELKTYGLIPAVLRLDWPDRSAPAVGWEFWRALRNKFQPEWNIVACCFGGHGRTGTCLAALLIEDGYGAKDAMEHVRTVHCTEAVESKAQEMYLEWLGSVMPPREEGEADGGLLTVERE